MSTTVVNVKVAHIRPRYQNLKEWCSDPNNIYIGRGGIVFVDGERYPKTSSKWANPYKVGKDGTIDEVVEKFKKHIDALIEKGEVDPVELKGKTLGCWCKPGKCHGDYLVQLAEN
jgi:hypothetical protein